ncbi:MAG: outer membrane lipoprotein carrier protein LolA [Bacteroidota bacterium]|nr:outer membrane lipoprotein carrier protein LolA [Bacteroidota bacterium]
MKKYILISALVLISLGKTFAVDNKSDSILKAVSAKYKSFKTYKASFVYNLENKKDKINITKKGTLYVKGLKFKIEMGNLEIFCDGKTIWKYNKEDNEVEINTFNASKNDLSPQKILNTYEKGFISEFVEEKMENGVVMQQIRLTPIDKTKNIHTVKLFVQKQGKIIVRSKLYGKFGDVYTYEIPKFQAHIKILDNFFVFNKKAHPGVTENDLRSLRTLKPRTIAHKVKPSRYSVYHVIR